MMRRPLTTLTLVATCVLLLVGAALALAGGTGASRDAGVGRGDAASAQRSWPLTLSAAPDDMTLAEVSFPRAAHRQQISSGSLQVAVGTPFGDDYLAAGAPRLAGTPRLLVLLVNRPSALLDPVSVHVRLSTRAALGPPLVLTLADPLARKPAARKPAAHTPALCNLLLHGSALSASEVYPLHSRGQALAGFDAAGALAQAYDLVCGLAHASSFEQAVARPAGPSSPPAPSPTPPVGKLPGEGCVPRPGYACPGAYRSTPRPVAGGG